MPFGKTRKRPPNGARTRPRARARRNRNHPTACQDSPRVAASLGWAARKAQRRRVVPGAVSAHKILLPGDVSVPRLWHPWLAPQEPTVSVQLDHAIVPARNRRATAELLATILDVPWAESGAGPFCPVFMNEGLTLDVGQAEGPCRGAPSARRRAASDETYQVGRDEQSNWGRFPAPIRHREPMQAGCANARGAGRLVAALPEARITVLPAGLLSRRIGRRRQSLPDVALHRRR